MSRIEKVREVVDSVLEAMTDPEERRCAYIHLYGVAQAAALIAGKRKENMELSIVAAMLHDLYAYKNMDPADHAHRGGGDGRGDPLRVGGILRRGNQIDQLGCLSPQ